MTLTAINSQEEDLNTMLRKLSRIRDFLSKKSSDQLSGTYNDDFNELTSIQDKCRTAFTNINDAKQRLTQCNKQIIKINKVLLETKQILNSKKVGTMLGRTRTHILDNRPYYSKDIDYKKQDRDKKSDTKNQREAKRIRRETEYPIRDIIDNAFREDPENYDEFIEEAEAEEEYDPFDEDPLFGTHTAPRGGKHSGKHSNKQKKRTKKTRKPKQKNTRKKRKYIRKD
jgi:hypothetical protein